MRLAILIWNAQRAAENVRKMTLDLNLARDPLMNPGQCPDTGAPAASPRSGALLEQSLPTCMRACKVDACGAQLILAGSKRSPDF